MWGPEKCIWRAAMYAVGCAGLIMHPVSVRSSTDAIRPAPVERSMSTMLAQGPDESSESGVTADPGEPRAPASPDWPGDAPSAASPRLSGWRIPPVRWGGSLTTEVRDYRSEADPRRRQAVGIADIRAASYVWQPWLATVSGGLGWLAASDEVMNPGASQQSRDAKSTAVTGNGETTVFPLSRFPFNAYFGVTDSRASGEQTLSDITNTRAGVRQSYRPLEGNANYAARFDRSILESPAFGRDTVDALGASMNRSSGPQELDFSGSRTSNTRSDTGERAALSQLTARHSYRPEPEFSVENLASATRSDFHLISAGLPSDSRSQFTQANSFMTWRPEEGSPLQMTGGGRMFRSVIANDVGDAEALTLSGNIAATYAVSARTSLTGGATVTQLYSDAADNRTTTENAGATHLGEPVPLLSSVYTWNAAANIANQTGPIDGDRKNASGQLGHNLARNLKVEQGSQVDLGFGQSLNRTYDTATGDSQTFINSGTASWRLTREAATTAYVGLLASDSRTTGYNANHFQLINLQASGQIQFDRSSSAAVNLTAQGVRQSREPAPDRFSAFNASGNLSYIHLRAFDVPRLHYHALYSVNDSQSRTRLQGDVNAPREQVSKSFEQRLDYGLGRLATRLSMRIAEIDGRRNTLVFLRVTREFGSY